MEITLQVMEILMRYFGFGYKKLHRWGKLVGFALELILFIDVRSFYITLALTNERHN